MTVAAFLIICGSGVLSFFLVRSVVTGISIPEALA